MSIDRIKQLAMVLGVLALLVICTAQIQNPSLSSGISWAGGVFGWSGSTSGSATRTIPAVAGTTSNAVIESNAVQFPTAQSQKVVTANFTTTATTLATAGVITGLSWTAPASVASVWSFHCDLVYSQATAAVADIFGVTTAQTPPTTLLVYGQAATTQTGTVVMNNAIITTATSTTVITATPGAFGAIGTAADMYQVHLWGTAEIPSNASPTQIGIAAATGSASDALTIYRGSSCFWY